LVGEMEGGEEMVVEIIEFCFEMDESGAIVAQ
jgi:hypothetical protein